MSIWDEQKFPTCKIEVNATSFPGKHKKMAKPFCWSPTEPFYFGGKRFIALYPCIAFETKNFGFVVQRQWDGCTLAME